MIGILGDILCVLYLIQLPFIIYRFDDIMTLTLTGDKQYTIDFAPLGKKND